MSVIINTNVDSIKIQNCLTSSTSNMSKTMERMSTGLKINSAKDDAAGTVIAAKMQVQLEGNEICQQNVQNGNAMLSTAEGNIDIVVDNMTRIRDLVLQAKNGTYSTEEIEAMDLEVQERIQEVNRVCSSAEYSELKLFSDTELQTNGINLQVGQNGDADNVINANKHIFDTVKFSAITKGTAMASGMQNYHLTRSTATNEALNALDEAIDNLTNRKAYIGAAESRLDSALENLTTGYTNLSASKSVITDADIAKEASEYTNANILQQISTSMLSQANQTPSIALSII